MKGHVGATLLALGGALQERGLRELGSVPIPWGVLTTYFKDDLIFVLLLLDDAIADSPAGLTAATDHLREFLNVVKPSERVQPFGCLVVTGPLQDVPSKLQAAAKEHRIFFFSLADASGRHAKEDFHREWDRILKGESQPVLENASDTTVSP